MKKTKTVLILAAVTGALLLGGCGSEKTKITGRKGSFPGKLQVCPGGVPELYPERSEAGTVLSRSRYRKLASWQI